MSRRSSAVVVVLGLALVGALGVTVAGVANGASTPEGCQAIEDRQVCVQELTAPETLVIGEAPENMSVTVENVGETAASPLVVVNTVDPDNETSTFQIGQPELGAGEERTLSQPLNASTPGTHGVQVVLVDAATQGQYDVSEPAIIEVRSEPAPGLGGPIDRTEVALVALLFALLGIAGLAYRELRG